MNPFFQSFICSALLLLEVWSVGSSEWTAACEKKMDELRSCTRGALGPSDRQVKIRQQRKLQERGCFTNNDCNDPTELLERVERCRDEVFDSLIQPKLRSCTGFPVEDHLAADPAMVPRRPVRTKKPKNELGDLCRGNETAADGVRQCLRQLRIQHRKSTQLIDRFEINVVAQMASVRKCFSLMRSIDQDCIESSQQRRTMVCICAKEKLWETEDEEIEIALELCDPDASSQDSVFRVYDPMAPETPPAVHLLMEHLCKNDRTIFRPSQTVSPRRLATRRPRIPTTTSKPKTRTRF